MQGMIFLTRVLLILLLSPILIFGQVENKCHKSTEGKNFWFGFMENRWYSGNNYVEITVTAREATSFSIYVGSNKIPIQENYSIGNNDSKQIIIPWDPEEIEATGSETVQNRGIHLVSEKPVNVYVLNYDLRSADVAVIYPVESLGTEYFAMCYTPNVIENSDGSYKDGRNSEFLIVATEDNTNISITPSVVTELLRPADSTFTIILNAGEIYQVQSNNRKNLQGQGDLTGSRISSDKPIAFYSGSLSTTVPYGECCWDHLYEQIPPVHSWGREYYIVPLKSREQDRYRIIAAENNTTINIEGKGIFYLNRGEIKEFILYNYEPIRVLADKSILIAQYSQSQQVDYSYTGGNGDPFMIILSPTSQTKNDVTFVAYNSSLIQKYFVNIVSLTSEIENIKLDGNSIDEQFKLFSNNKYSYAQIQIGSGTHRLWNINNEKGFLAYVYGFGSVESYGYGVGFNLNLVLDIGQNINFDGDTLLLCNGDEKTLDAGPYFDTYTWNTGDSLQRLTVTNGGEFSVTTTTNDGCILFDSIYIRFSEPETFIGTDLDSCTPYSVELNAGSFTGYQWSTNDTTQKIIVDKTGSYSVTVTDQYGCIDSDTMQLTIYDSPEIEIFGDTLICGDTITSLNVVLKNADPELWNYEGSIQWSTNKPSKLNFSDINSVQTEIYVSEWGEYELYFKVKTINECESFGMFKVSFFDTPTPEIKFVDNSDNKCKGYYRQVLYSGTATEKGQFYWDFGGSNVIDTLGWQNYNVSIGAFNTDPLITLFVEENGCWSDTSELRVGANPDFKLETKKSRGCDTTTINFTGTLNVPDSLLFEWDFGDGTQISNLQNTSHFYSDTGFYDVGLSVTNVLNGCRIAFTIDDFIKIFPTPVADFSADESYCYNNSLEVIYLNNIDSSFCYWDFSGAHEIENNNDLTHLLIDSSFAKITLTVNEFGCFSDSITKIVKRKPHFDFYTSVKEGCQPFSTEIFADPFDDSLEFVWIQDSLPEIQGNSGLYFFSDSGRYNIELSAHSLETNCVDTLVKINWIKVYPKPVAAFEVNYPVATIENSTISFTNNSEFGSNFFWDFDDGNYSQDINPQNTYTELGEYNAKLITKSEFNCLDTSFFLIKIMPFSVFTPNAFRPDSEIAENKYFMPVGIGADPDRFHIKIFNRWGHVVFESVHPENKWDGKINKNKSAPMGNYIWTATYFDIQGLEHKQNGQVLLIR